MNRFRVILKVVLLLGVVVLLGVAIGWLSSAKKVAPAAPPQITNAAAPESVEKPEPLRPIAHRPVTATVGTAAPAVQNTAPLQPAAESVVSTNWEDKLDQVLASDADESQKAKQMAALLPTLPEDGQVEVAQHLSNLVTDQEYGLISGFLTNSLLPEAVLDVLIADSLNRPNSVKLPLLLDVAKDPSNPKAAEAKDILELYIEEDHGQDWAGWQTSIQQWLANNPD